MPDDRNFVEEREDPPAVMKAADEPAKQPDTPEERHKKRLEAVENEPHEKTSERRQTELQLHHKTHMENVQASHEKYPAPLDFRNCATDAERNNWNARANDIQMANRAYHLAVRATFAEHQGEDAHLGRLRAAKNAA